MEEKNIQFPETVEDAEGIPLPDELLEGIAGGEFSEGQKAWLDYMIRLYKEAGHPIDSMIAYNHRGHLPAETIAEMDEYVKQHW